jgi:hypothetical protein
MRVVPAILGSGRLLSATLLLIALSLVQAGCGSPSQTTTTTTPPAPPAPPSTPSQPSYPSTPPVAITWSASTSNLPAPIAQDPAKSAWGTGSDDFPLTVSNPTAGASVPSPMNVVASASPTNPIFFMRVYVDNVSVYYTSSNSLNTQIFAAPGAHTMVVMAEDSKGYVSAIPLNITVTAQTPTIISDIQNLPGWQSCSADFPAGSQRAGQLCAAGLGTAVSTMTQNQSTPSMDGKSAEFSISGPTGYSNELNFNPIAGGNNLTAFTYDLYFWIDNPDAAQAMEFDLNQAFDDTTTGAPQRWTWGSECNFKGETPGMWDIWDDANSIWRETTVPCNPFPANTWNHITWNVQRVGQQVYYNTLTVNGTVYQVNTYYNNQQGWDLEEIDTAFQMDLDSNADPYNVLLDDVSLTAN